MAYAKYFLSEEKPRINPSTLKKVVKAALLEDTGKGDITSEFSIPKSRKIEARLIAKEDFVACGIDVAREVFKKVDSGVKFIPQVKDGAKVRNNAVLARMYGSAKSILKAERVALNLLSLLSGVATKTNKFVKKIGGRKTKITDTRKTIAGLRELQKYAVRVGGGFNHRISLDEMILIKDNHLKILGSFAQLPAVPKGYKIEIEAQDLKEFRHALSLKPDVIMLDNMPIKDIKEAVNLRNKILSSRRILLEASGGIGINNISKYAATGIDIISVGELTDSVKSIDISLEVV